MDFSLAADEFASKYAENAVPDMLKAIHSIKRYNRFVLLAALATSYLHQAHYLWAQDAGYFAYLVPLIFDAAMVSMLIVVRTPGISRDADYVARQIVARSATVNGAAARLTAPRDTLWLDGVGNGHSRAADPGP